MSLATMPDHRCFGESKSELQEEHMIRQPNHSESSSVVVAGYVRRSSEMQKDNYSIDAQKRAIRDACKLRDLPEPIFYEDDERSARGEQIAKRPAFKRLLEDIQTGHVQIVIVHTLDRWSRNVMVTLQSFRILSQSRTAFISLSEHIDYSTPEGMLQLTILAAFAAYFSDMLSKHTSKGKGERAAQGLYNGDVPFGYRWTGPKTPPEHDPDEFPGLRMLGELRMQGYTADEIAERLNAAGYRTGSKRFGARLFTNDTVTAMLRTEFYAAFAPDDDRGTVRYHDQRHRGLHQAAFTYEEWQQIRSITQSMARKPQQQTQARRFYEFAGYVADIHCGLPLRAQGKSTTTDYEYYRDTARERRIPCPAGGHLTLRSDLVRAQFGEMLKSLLLPDNWREEIRRQMIAEAQAQGTMIDSVEREKERLKLKRTRILKQHREGYIDDEEFHGEMAAVELALHQLQTPEVNGVRLDDVLAAGEHIPGMAALWDEATPEERREMVMLLLEPGGLYYDLELKMIAALKPRPAFLPILRMLKGVVEYDEVKGIIVTENWQDRNRRESDYLQEGQRDRQTTAASQASLDRIFVSSWIVVRIFNLQSLDASDIEQTSISTNQDGERCLINQCILT